MASSMTGTALSLLQITEMTRKRTQEEAENKTKTKHWWENSENQTINKRPEYIEKLNRKECIAIIKTEYQCYIVLVKVNKKKQISKEHHMQILQELPWNPEAIGGHLGFYMLKAKVHSKRKIHIRNWTTTLQTCKNHVSTANISLSMVHSY